MDLTLAYYTHLSMEDKASAIAKLPEFELHQALAITGTDGAENSTRYSTRNSDKICKSLVNFSKSGVFDGNKKKTVTPFENKDLQLNSDKRAKGLEPSTFSLEG